MSECMWYRASTRPDSTEMEAPDKCRAKGCRGWLEDCNFKLQRIECVSVEEFYRANRQAHSDRQADVMMHEGRIVY